MVVLTSQPDLAPFVTKALCVLQIRFDLFAFLDHSNWMRIRSVCGQLLACSIWLSPPLSVSLFCGTMYSILISKKTKRKHACLQASNQFSTEQPNRTSPRRCHGTGAPKSAAMLLPDANTTEHIWHLEYLQFFTVLNCKYTRKYKRTLGSTRRWLVLRRMYRLQWKHFWLWTPV